MNQKQQSPRSKLLWSLLFVLIAAGTVFAVVSQSRAFTFDAFFDYVSGMSKPWLLAAVGATLCFIIFEGEAVIAVCHAFGYRASHRSGFVYSASDIYFSAITPSASGGQPACAYFMIKDGIPPMVATIALIVNLTMYTFSILILGTITLLVHPDLYQAFGTLSKVLIGLGYMVQVLLAVFFLMVIFREKLLHSICANALHLLCKLRILRHEEDKQRKLAGHMEEFNGYAQMISGRKGMMAKALLYNLIQRGAVIAVPLFVYLAAGGELGKAFQFWAVQCFAVLGSNTVPIPGAMGVSDYIMLDGFANLMPEQGVIHFELLSRTLSFYGCVVLCGTVTLLAYLLLKRRDKKRKENEAPRK